MKIKLILQISMILLQYYQLGSYAHQIYSFITLFTKMSNQKQIFSTSLLLYSTVKGFGLQKLRKNSISSTFKFKAKSHHPKHLQEGQIKNIEQEQITDQLHRDAKQKMHQVKYLKKNQFNSTLPIQKQQNRSANCVKQRVRNRVTSKTLQPSFPDINKKRNRRITTKSFRKVSEQSNQEIINDIGIKGSYQVCQNKNLNGIANKTEDQIEYLIKKQVLKTENQAILRQGQLKFDEKQVFNVLRNLKRPFGNKTIKKKRESFYNEDDYVNEHNSIINKFSFNGPDVKNFNPIRTRYVETTHQKSKKYCNRYSPDKEISKKLRKKQYSYKQPHIVVEGWEKQQNLSQDSDEFQAQNQANIGWTHKSERLS